MLSDRVNIVDLVNIVERSISDRLCDNESEQWLPSNGWEKGVYGEVCTLGDRVWSAAHDAAWTTVGAAPSSAERIHMANCMELVFYFVLRLRYGREDSIVAGKLIES